MTTRSSLLMSALLLTAAPAAAAPVPPEFLGEWVAASAACTAPARIRIEAARLTLVNGADMESFGGVEIATGFFPPDYSGIQQALLGGRGGRGLGIVHEPAGRTVALVNPLMVARPAIHRSVVICHFSLLSCQC